MRSERTRVVSFPTDTAVADPLHHTDSPASPALRDLESLSSMEEFAAFYDREAMRLLGFVMKLGSDAHLAADIVQSTFEDALRAWATINNHRAWVRRVATRKLMRARDPARRREEPVDDLLDSEQPLLPGQGGHLLRPDLVVEFSDKTRRVLQLVAELPPAQRTVMAWAMDEYTTDEIATLLHMTPAAVRQNLSRARTAMKEKLNGGDGA